VAKSPLEQQLLRALRNEPERTLGELAEAVGFPRTNYGRTLGNRIRTPVRQLVTRGLVEEHGHRYRLSKSGRLALADRALNSAPDQDDDSAGASVAP
jgi:DNA-binding IclR family transcriptional regulator